MSEQHSGWVIECGPIHAPNYWSGGGFWNLDPKYAVKFARSQDAQRVLPTVLPLYDDSSLPVSMRIVEHCEE